MIGSTLTLRRALVLVVVFGLVLPALFINGYTWFQRYDDDVRKQTQELLKVNADILANGMRDPLWNINHESAATLIDAMMSRNEDIIRIKVRDQAMRDFAYGEYPQRRVGHTASIARPVLYRGGVIGSVDIEVGSARLRKLMIDSLIVQAIALTAQVVLSIALILMLLEKRLVGPLQRLGRGAERLANRQLDQPFTWDKLDEIGLLSRRLEDTRVSLRRLFAELDRKNMELELDIDKRKRVEQELNERERRFRLLVEQSPIAIIEWDAGFRVVEWNAAAERIFGHTRAQAIGRHGSFIDPALAPDARGDDAYCAPPGTADHHTVTENIRSDGAILICQWNHAQISDETSGTSRLLSIAQDITEQRRVEDAQRLSDAKFSGAFQCNPDPITISRIGDGVIIDVNQAFERTSGFLRREAVGKNSVELELWADAQDRLTLLELVRRDHVVRDFPSMMRTKHGSLRRCLMNVTMFDVGAERFMVAVIRDVTDQRMLEEQKAEADRALLRLAQGSRYLAGESFFDLLVADLASALRTDAAGIALALPDTPGRMRTLASHEYGRAVANYEFDLAGTPCERTLAGTAWLAASGVRARFPHDRRLAERGWDSYAGAPLRDPAGKVIGELAVMHSAALGNPDLVRSLLQVFSERASAELERKRAEAELRSSEQRFSTIFQLSPVAMLVTQVDAERSIKNVNGAFERLFLRSRDEVIGRNTIELDLYCDPQDCRMLVEELDRAGQSMLSHAIWMQRGDGSKVLVQVSGHSFSHDAEQFSIMACEDITDKHRIENEIRELNATLEERVVERTNELQRANRELGSALENLNKAQEELVRSEKLAALGSLVAGIAHELNTPIGNSLMVASTLADQTRSLRADYRQANGIKRSALEGYMEDAGKAGEILVRNLHRAADLVTSFKQVAIDQTSSQRRRFLLANVVAEIILTMWPTLRKSACKVEQRIPADLSLDSFPGPLGQVITNLINNALLHAYAGRDAGTIEIAARQTEAGWMELSVRDDGCGIAPANLSRIFDPFFTTRLGAGGSGLGLNITHNIVTGVLGGRVRVHSEIGIGTTFVLSLPLIAPLRQADGAASREEQLQGGGGI